MTLFTVLDVCLYRFAPHRDSGTLGLAIVGDDSYNLERIKSIRLSHVATSVLQRRIKIAESNKI